MPKTLEILVGLCYRSRGIGVDGKLPWKLSKDLSYFSELTRTETVPGKRNVVLMGRKTWESLPKRFKPLPGRLNVVLTRTPGRLDTLKDQFQTDLLDPSVHAVVSGDFDRSITALLENEQLGRIFIIGGSQLYETALLSGKCSIIHATEVFEDFECDTFFPAIDFASFPKEKISNVQVENDIAFQFVQYKVDGLRGPFRFAEDSHEEYKYLSLVREVLDSGIARGDRTGTGTLALFGKQMRFSLRNDVFPLLTTKRVFWRGVAKELLWFVSGKTNANLLKDDNIRIWDGNSSREYLDSIGLVEREEGDLGPVYGFQWRHFGASYGTMHDEYEGKGIDQLKNVISMLKSNPNSRRMLVSAWNPLDLSEMALPPCHILFQFYVADGELSCQMYQRSCDLGLGVPFNIASYALLTRMVAQVVGLKPGDFVHVLGDAHVYQNHTDALEEQLRRRPFPFPKLLINPEVKEIDGFKFEDFKLEGYRAHKKIAMKMAV